MAEVTAYPLKLVKGLRVYQGTLTDSYPAIDITATANDGAETFTFIKCNITNTASAAASKLIDLQVGGVSQFNVTRAGVVTATGAINGVTISAGAVSGITTLAASGVITSTYGGGADAVFKNASTGTNNNYFDLTSTGGRTVFGIEASVGASLFTGSTAYASVFGAVAARACEFATNATVRMGIVGVAGTPANSSVGNIYIKESTAPTGNPTAMGYLWVESGALKYRGTSGTVTTIAAA